MKTKGLKLIALASLNDFKWYAYSKTKRIENLQKQLKIQLTNLFAIQTHLESSLLHKTA